MKVIKIGLLGCGKVGTAFCRLVRDKADLFARRDGVRFDIAAIAVKDPDKPRDECVPTDRIHQGWEKVTSRDDIDVFVELIGGSDDAHRAVQTTLGRGVHTVTANKELLSAEGHNLTQLAADNRCGLCFEAAVGSGTPVVAATTHTLSANRFEKVIGIVNGTTNFILSRMTDDELTYKESLNLAVERGFSEADPTFDVEGRDAAQKLSVLAALAFGVEVPYTEIYTEGITNIQSDDIALAASFDYVIKLLAIGHRTENGIELRVHPALVSNRHPLASVRDELNAFMLSGDVSGEVMLYGKGAGPTPTAGAVLSDVARLAPSGKSSWFARKWCYENIEHIPIGDIETGYHIIFPVLDKPGIIGRITSTLGSYGINIESAHAHIPEKGAGQGIVQVLSSRARERDVRAALTAVQDSPLLAGKARFYRVEVPHGA